MSRTDLDRLVHLIDTDAALQRELADAANHADFVARAAAAHGLTVTPSEIETRFPVRGGADDRELSDDELGAVAGGSGFGAASSAMQSMHDSAMSAVRNMKG